MKFKDKTRGGLKVEIWATDLVGDYPICGAITDDTGGRQLATWTQDGSRCRCDPGKDHRDLIPIPDYSDFEKEDMCWVWDTSRECRSVEFFSHRGKRGGVHTTDNPGYLDTMHWRYCEKVFQPLSDKRVFELWEVAMELPGLTTLELARLVEKEIMKQVTK